MKMKSLAMIAMSGLVAASFAYVAPALADDMNNGTTDSSQPSAAPENAMQNQGNTSQDNNNSGATQGDNANTGSSDEGSPDTATGSGDDDY
jgi:hypothetical protein